MVGILVKVTENGILEKVSSHSKIIISWRMILVMKISYLLRTHDMQHCIIRLRDVINPLQPKRTLRSSLEYALFYRICALYRALEVLDTFNWWKILSLKYFKEFLRISKKPLNFISYFVTFFYDFQNSVILYQFNRAKQLQFSCKLNKLLNNSGCKRVKHGTLFSNAIIISLLMVDRLRK